MHFTRPLREEVLLRASIFHFNQHVGIDAYRDKGFRGIERVIVMNPCYLEHEENKDLLCPFFRPYVTTLWDQHLTSLSNSLNRMCCKSL